MKILRGHSINWWFLRSIFIIVLTLDDPLILILPVNKVEIVLSRRIKFYWTIVVPHLSKNKVEWKIKCVKWLIIKSGTWNENWSLWCVNLWIRKNKQPRKIKKQVSWECWVYLFLRYLPKDFSSLAALKSSSSQSHPHLASYSW